MDETFIGREPGKPVKQGGNHKMNVLSLVERNSGHVRSFVVEGVKTADLAPIVFDNLAQEARLMTDEANQYKPIGRHFADHGVVNHARDEYVSKEDETIFTNTVEGYFSIFKRGMKGVYQHCGKQHLHRYLAEFDFRYSNRIARGWTIRRGPPSRSMARSGSASPIAGLTESPKPPNGLREA